MPTQYDERNEKLSIVSRRSIRRNDRAKSRREENRCDTGCNELGGKLVEGGGRKSENEWRVVVRSDMCTWHASNACLPPRSLSLPLSLNGSLLRSSSLLLPLANVEILGSLLQNGNFDLSIDRWKNRFVCCQEEICFRVATCVVVVNRFFLFFF